MNRLITIILAILSLLPAAFSASAEQYSDYAIKVGEFTRLKVSSNMNVIYRSVQDSLGMVAFSVPERLADLISCSIKKGTLRLTLDPKDTKDVPTVYVYSSFLTGVENENDGSVSVFSPAPCPEFEVKLIGNGSIIVDNVNSTQVSASLITGNGTITITGSAGEASVSMTGAGTIDISCLSADDVSCKPIGSGRILCWARNRLSVKGLGSTKVYYRGNPQISKAWVAKVFPITELK